MLNQKYKNVRGVDKITCSFDGFWKENCGAVQVQTNDYEYMKEENENNNNEKKKKRR